MLGGTERVVSGDLAESLFSAGAISNEGQTAKTRFVSLSSPKRGEGRGEELRLTFIGATTLCIQNAVKELTLDWNRTLFPQSP